MLGASQSGLKSNLKRLESLKLAIMIDNGRISEAKSTLEKLYAKNEYTDREKEARMLNTSLLGILKKQLGKTEEERMEGLHILEEAKGMDSEIN
mmetsp:Transcript_26475/g.40420  ORF Transcript_26475/g.40420 Transcript_26475/m.40420 type:complete len:94 (+) Transcript_26475:1011-1292(+)